MIETAIIFGLVALVAAVSWIPVTAAIPMGLVMIGVSLAIGLPASAIYHVQLGRALALGPLPKNWRWWLDPTRFHADVPEHARDRVMRWFYAGVVGFTGAVLGCVLIGAALLRLPH